MKKQLSTGMVIIIIVIVVVLVVAIGWQFTGKRGGADDQPPPSPDSAPTMMAPKDVGPLPGPAPSTDTGDAGKGG